MDKITTNTQKELVDFIKDFECSVFVGDDSILRSFMDKANKLSKKLNKEARAYYKYKMDQYD